MIDAPIKVPNSAEPQKDREDILGTSLVETCSRVQKESTFGDCELLYNLMGGIDD